MLNKSLKHLVHFQFQKHYLLNLEMGEKLRIEKIKTSPTSVFDCKVFLSFSHVIVEFNIYDSVTIKCNGIKGIAKLESQIYLSGIRENLIHSIFSFYAKNYPSEGVIPEFHINSAEDIFESQFD